ncbi:MaoC family dehydratase [Pseudomaricurvus alkylphenolicus]|uniref:FAS1-like dehydratase domain-containing protein n=1 Tax=Pseudomaricurvus alkylphenolicus TaxID=1306991 RepID=UPI0014214CDC|nr:MaoC family dehydratase N-terminal domain-containing protein [Pseudomaricurvus alkylphenolicus]NIB38057.1 MaoC family dehydratase [Pseudomaricurvus alkylphenolicus]
MSNSGWGKWGSWEETQALLGKIIGVSHGADAVEKGSIRRWLEAKEFDCPIHTDSSAAKDAGFPDIVAPATMAFTYGVGPYWKPGDPQQQLEDPAKQINIPAIFDVPAPCILSFATSVDVEFGAPLLLGDQLTNTSKLVGVTHKTMSVGKGAFLRQQDTYTNQRGETVAIVHMDIFRFVPHEDAPI